jgi:hypothetical protein
MTTGIGVRPGQLEANPGTAAAVVVTVTNHLPSASQFQVRVVGSDATWSGEPHLTPMIEPGAHTAVEIVVDLPLGFPAGDHLLGIEVVPLTAEGTPSADQQLRRVADLVVSVGSLSGLHAVLEPRTVYGRRRAKVHRVHWSTALRGGGFRKARGGQASISLRNRSYEPMTVSLRASSPGGEISVRFDRDEVLIEPGHIVPVKAKVKGSRPMFGQPRRTPFTVEAQGRGSSVYLEGSYSRPARVRPGAIKGVGILTVLALWAGSLAVIYDRVTDDDEPEQATAQQASESEGGGGGTNGGSGTDGEGSGVQDLSLVPASVEASGQVTAREPEGVRVRVRSVSLVDEISQDAIFNSGPRGSTSRGTKLFGRRGGMIHNRIVPAEMATTTDAEGRWAVGGLEAPGFFEIRFSKAGYATRAYVVEVPEDGSPIVLDTDLEAGDGGISGFVLGPDGPIGGADITVTDGTVTLTTQTPTTGAVGQWSVEGLTTPGSYLVTATRRGYGTATQLVRLSGGQTVSGVQIRMQPGTGSILGAVRSSAGPLGDITLTATDGDVVRSATTLTEGPVGSFTLPDLPSPGIYTLTVQGEGWVSQTRDVVLTGDEARVDIEMTARTGIAYGRITDTAGLPLAGVGITAISEDHLYKNTTAPDGRFELVGLEPGSYVIEFQSFEHHTGSSLITIGPGSLREINLSLAPRDTLEPPPNNSLTFSFSAEGDISVTERATGAVASTGGGSTASFTNLPAGIRTFDITGVGFQPAVVQFRMGLNGPFSTSVTLRPLVIVELTVRQRVFEQAPLGGADVVIRRADTIACPPTNVTPGCQPFVGRSIDSPNSLDHGKVVDADGDVPELTDGQWIAIATLDGYAQGDQVFNTSFDTSPLTTAEVRMDRLGQIELEVIEPVIGTTTDDITWRRLNGVEITVVGGPQDGRVFGPLDDAGQPLRSPYLLTGLEPGPYRLRLDLDDYRTITIPAATATTISLNSTELLTGVMVPTPDATHGRVVWDVDRRTGQDDEADLFPIPAAEVQVFGIASFEPGVFGEASEVERTWPGPNDPPNLTDEHGFFSFADDAGPIFGDADITIPLVRASPLYLFNGFLPQTFTRPAATDVGDLVLEPRPTNAEVIIVLEHGAAPVSPGAAGRIEVQVLEGPVDDPQVTFTRVADAAFGSLVLALFTTNNAPAGRYELLARYVPGTNDPNRFTEQQWTVVVGPNFHTIPQQTLEAKGRVTGTVAAIPAGQDPALGPINTSPLDGATIRLLHGDGNPVLDADGEERVLELGTGTTFEFEEIDPGTYRIEAERDGYTLDLMPELANFSVGIGSQATQNVTMRPLASITFTVTGELFGGGGTTPLGGDAVTASASQANVQFDVEWVDAPDGGFFEVQGLDSDERRGEVFITIVAEGYETRLLVLGDEDPGADAPGLDWGELRELGAIQLQQLPGTIILTLTSDDEDIDLSDPDSNLVIDVYRVSTNTLVASVADFTYDAEAGTWTIENLAPDDYRIHLNAFNHAPLDIPDDQNWIRVQGGQAVELSQQLVHRLSRVTGTVTLQVGGTALTSLGGTTVELLDASGASFSPAVTTPTAANGTFSITNVEDGTYRLRITRDGFTAYASPAAFAVDPYLIGGERTYSIGQVQLTAIQHTVDLTIRSAVSTDPDSTEGDPIDGATVTLQADAQIQPNTAESQSPRLTADGGKVQFTNVTPGSYRVVVDPGNNPNRGANVAYVLALTTSPTNLDETVTIDEGLLEVWVEVEVDDEDDPPPTHPLGGVVVDLFREDGGLEASFPYPLDQVGNPALLAVYARPADDYLVVVRGPTAAYVTAEFEPIDIVSGSVTAIGTEAQPVLLVLGAAVELQLSELDTGIGISGATVTYAGPRGPGTAGPSATDGTIQLQGLPPGNYTFSLAQNPAWDAHTTSQVSLAAGSNDPVPLVTRAYGSLTTNPVSGSTGSGSWYVQVTRPPNPPDPDAPDDEPPPPDSFTYGPVGATTATRTIARVPTGSYASLVACRPSFTTCSHIAEPTAQVIILRGQNTSVSIQFRANN